MTFWMHLYRESQSGRHGQALVQEWKMTPTRLAGQQQFNMMNCAESKLQVVNLTSSEAGLA